MRHLIAIEVFGPGLVMQFRLAVLPAVQAKAQVIDKGDFDFKGQHSTGSSNRQAWSIPLLRAILGQTLTYKRQPVGQYARCRIRTRR